MWLGITAELLPASSQRESSRDVVFGMLCATTEPALEPVDPRALGRAKEIINLVAARVEEHLALTGGLTQPMPRSADGRTDA
ncbi:MAG: hypothetical protein M3022_01780 [Actinomycetota bacterium]|nr:hypothetical protein [Actinomycetota bacterium]